MNEFVWHAISFFLDIYEEVGLLGPKVALRYLLPLERLPDSFQKKKKTKTKKTLSLGIEFQNCSDFFVVVVLGKTLRFSIKH